MESKVKNTIISNNLIDKGSTLICGISGGADSVFMLHILDKLKAQLDFDIVITHIHHGLRGEEADRDLEFSKSLANDLDYDFYFTHVSMSDYAKENRITEEEAGRILRMNFFQSIAKKYDKALIALAHNFDDQAETVLQRIIRGSGIRGLKGISYKRDNIIRPVLDCKRSEIEAYLKNNDLKYMTDSTNLLSLYTRNKLRLEIIPKIKELNPAFSESIVRISKISDELYSYIESEANKIFDEISIIDDNKISIDLKELLKQNIVIKKELIFLAIEKLNKTREGITAKHLDSILELMNLQTGKMLNNIPKITVLKDYENLVFNKKEYFQSKNFDFELKLGKNYYKEIDNFIECEILKNGFEKTADRYTYIIDRDKIKGQLRIRNRKAGDKIKPLKMNGTKKVKDIFIDAKVSKEMRDFIPIVCDAEKLIWIIGFKKSDEVKIEKNTKNFLKIKFGGNDA